MSLSDVYSTRRPTTPKVDQGFVLGGYRLSERIPPVPIIIITPTCDFHQSKDFLSAAVALPVLPCSVFMQTVAQLRHIPWDSAQRRADLRDLGSDKRQSFRNAVSRLLNGNIQSLHYLPPLPLLGHSFVQFDNPVSVPLTEVEQLPFIAVMHPPYREHLATRFCSYYLRVGTEDFPDLAADLHNTFSITA